MAVKKFILEFSEVSSRDTDRVGGKNAALGEMIRALRKRTCASLTDSQQPPRRSGFSCAKTRSTRRCAPKLRDSKKNSKSLAAAGKTLRALFLKGKFPAQVEEQIRQAYRELSKRYKKR